MYNFSKYEGLGNDFIIFESRDTEENIINNTNFVKKLCDRNYGVGADGIIIVKNPTLKGNIKMQIFNADGSEAEMCGNGVRCLTRYLFDKNELNIEENIVIETLAGYITAKMQKDKLVSVEMGRPILDPIEIPTKFTIGNNNLPEGEVLINDRKMKAFSVGMGNPHLIIPVENINLINLNKWGPKLETNKNFPSKTNVHFIEIRKRNEIKLKVWERGAGATLACGTGACACMVVAKRLDLVSNLAEVLLPGGLLKIKWNDVDDQIIMIGPAQLIYYGTLSKQYKY